MLKDEISDSDPIQCIDNDDDFVSLEQEELRQATSREDMRMPDRSGENGSGRPRPLEDSQGTKHGNDMRTSVSRPPSDSTGQSGEKASPDSPKHAVKAMSPNNDHSFPSPTPKPTCSLPHKTSDAPHAPPSVKRRRLTTNTLTTPFKTPLKTPLQRSSMTPQTAPTAMHHSVPPYIFSSPTVDLGPATSTTIPDSPLALEASIARTQADIAALIQARDLLLASGDASSRTLTAAPDHTAKLMRLTASWLSAARGAAEVLFEDAERRVENMGGVKAWRKGEVRASEGKSSWGWDEDEAREERRRAADRAKGEEEEMGTAEMEEREKQLEEAAAAAEEAEAEAEVVARQGQAEGEEEVNGLTMEMMLRSLSIDPDVLGWDSQEQKWVS